MEWFALLVPLFIVGLLVVIFKKSFTWWEVSLPLISTVIIILITKLIIISSKTKDTEYWGSMIVEARYYEYYESWVERTCSYTTTCCCDDKGNNCQTITHYYDCSYCDNNSAYWEVRDDVGNVWGISEKYYNYLKNRWKSIPEFVELNRNIDYYGSCGDDGDMYRIKWKGEIETSEAAVTKHTYENKIQSSKSAFKFENISNKEALKYGLYKYPKIYNYYKQKVILGLDSLPEYKIDMENIETYYQYFNGSRGAKNKVKIFICLFFDKSLSVVRKQQAYWDGANQNELIICIGLNKQMVNDIRKLDWVEAFSFTNNKRVLVDLREDIMSLESFQPYNIYGIIDKSIGNNIMYRDFKKDFSYLKVELSRGNIRLIYILSFIITLISCFYCLTNEFGETLDEYNIKQRWNEFIDKILKK